MILIKLICNIKEENESFAKGARAEITVMLNTKARIKAKNKTGKIVTEWVSQDNLSNMRYRAWWNGNKADFIAAKRLAEIGNVVLQHSKSHLPLDGEFDTIGLKKAINRYINYAEFYKNKDRGS